MICKNLAMHSYMSIEERASIGEAESSAEVLKLISARLGFKFLAITILSEGRWVEFLSYYDDSKMKFDSSFDQVEEKVYDLNIFFESANISNITRLLYLEKHCMNISNDLEGYSGMPIFLPDGRLLGAICILNCDLNIIRDLESMKTLAGFAKIIGGVFFANSYLDHK